MLRFPHFTIGKPWIKLLSLVALEVALVACVLAGISLRRPYKVLFSGMTELDETQVLEALRADGRFYPLAEQTGTITLSEDQIPAARMELARRGVLPSSGSWQQKSLLCCPYEDLELVEATAP